MLIRLDIRLMRKHDDSQNRELVNEAGMESG